MTELDQEVNLEALTISLGLENTEYEPEQFPGLVYRPPQLGATLMIFASGKVLIVGTTDKQTALESFRIAETSINEISN
jgi:transcription initiation factor TFIID TATA-box-binding protein